MGRDGVQVQQSSHSDRCISKAVITIAFYIVFVSDFQRLENIALDWDISI